MWATRDQASGAVVDDFSISEVAAAGGTLAIAPLPGRLGAYGPDLTRLREWRPGMVISMTTRAATERLGRDLMGAGIAWRRFPVADFDVPKPGADWAGLSNEAGRCLSNGGRLLIHCAGGCGRSGMVALRLMIEAGEAPKAALARLRAVRPCAVETEAQLLWAFAGKSA